MDKNYYPFIQVKTMGNVKTMWKQMNYSQFFKYQYKSWFLLVFFLIFVYNFICSELYSAQIQPFWSLSILNFFPDTKKPGFFQSMFNKL